MILLTLLAALLTPAPAGASRPEPVSIFVGPMVRDGFVDIDKGVSDSIRDLQRELRKNPSFVVVLDEAAAVIKLYVVARAKAQAGGSTEVSQASGTAGPGSAQGTSTTVTVPNAVNRLDTLLRVGSYERAFAGESDWVVSAWTRCASSVVKDLAVWLAANRDGLPSKTRPQ